MNSRFLRAVAVCAIGAFSVFGVTACGASGTAPSPKEEAINKVNDRDVYVPKNDIEGDNYNARMRLSDDPSTLWWCSSYPTNPNVKPFTIPIVGKLTSSQKRPYSTTQSFAGGADGHIASDFYSSEVPGPDGFYGASSEYRFGFDPAGNYHDFTALEMHCTTVPDIIQRNTTEIAITVKTDNFKSLDRRAEKAIEECRKVSKDPTRPCEAAATILGVE